MSVLGVALVTPQNGEAATVGNGTMVSLRADNETAVDRIHAKALELGSAEEGATGPRGGGLYGGYFCDLDGNKFCVFTVQS